MWEANERSLDAVELLDYASNLQLFETTRPLLLRQGSGGSSKCPGCAGVPPPWLCPITCNSWYTLSYPGERPATEPSSSNVTGIYPSSTYAIRISFTTWHELRIARRKSLSVPKLPGTCLFRQSGYLGALTEVPRCDEAEIRQVASELQGWPCHCHWVQWTMGPCVCRDSEEADFSPPKASRFLSLLRTWEKSVVTRRVLI